MISNTVLMVIAGIGVLVSVICIMILLGIIKKYPFVLKFNAKRFVFICGIDGLLNIVPGFQEGYGMRTDEGTYNFERDDVVSFYGTPAIIVYKPIARAVRPDVTPFFKKLKKHNIKDRSVYYHILNSIPKTKAEYIKEMQAIYAKEGVIDE